jgi:hypothetical protein
VTDIIPAEDARRYHSAGPKSLGSTRISHFREHGPVWWHLRYIANEIPQPETSDAMRQGSLVDCMLTEPAEFDRRYIAKPEGMSFATKEGKAWRAAQPDGIEIVPPEWIKIASDCVHAVGAHATAADMLADPLCTKQTSLRHVLDNGIVLQSRPDFLKLDPATMTGWYIDGKKTDDLEGFGRKAIDYGYHRQLAICQYLAARAGYKIDAYLLAYEWQRGSRARLYRMPETALAAGWLEVYGVIREIAERFEDNDWTDDNDGEIEDLEIPDWMLRRMGVA